MNRKPIFYQRFNYLIDEETKAHRPQFNMRTIKLKCIKSISICHDMELLLIYSGRDVSKGQSEYFLDS